MVTGAARGLGYEFCRAFIQSSVQFARRAVAADLHLLFTEDARHLQSLI